MDPLIRVAVAALFAALLFGHARRLASSRPNQRRAYQLAALAMLLVAAYNTADATGLADPVRQSAIGGAVVLALVATVVLFVRGFFAGEMQADHERAGQMARTYREQREREIDAAHRNGDKRA